MNSAWTVATSLATHFAGVVVTAGSEGAGTVAGLTAPRQRQLAMISAASILGKGLTCRPLGNPCQCCSYFRIEKLLMPTG